MDCHGIILSFQVPETSSLPELDLLEKRIGKGRYGMVVCFWKIVRGRW